MKKKILFIISMVALLVCMLAVSVSAEVTVYDDAPETSVIKTSTDDIIVFDDGFSCPAGYVVKDQTSLDFNFDWINEKASKSYTKSNIKELDIPEGITTISTRTFSKHTVIARASIPQTAVNLGECIFEYATALTQCTFEHPSDSSLIRMPHYMFAGCTSLVAMSLPDCIQYISPEESSTLYNSMFSGCTNLTALYLPRGLKTLKGDSQGGAVFFNCTNLYFVEEPFTYDNIPNKPDVYRFPENLEYFKGETFKNCKNLNSVLVFGEKITDLSDTGAIPWAFNGCGDTSTIVFLGDMVGLSCGYWNVAKIYFANEADKAKTDIDTLNGSKTFVFCHAEDNTTHLYLEELNREATCTVDGIVGYACFCGTARSDATVVKAKGHENTEIYAISYNGANKFFENGDTTYTCGVCGEKHTVTGDRKVIFKSLGYSVTERNTGRYAITQGFSIDKNAMAEYNKYSDYDVVGYGLVAGTVQGLGENADIFATDGTVNNQKAAVVDFMSRDQYDIFEIKVSGLEKNESYASAQLYCCGYCLVQIGENIVSYYASEGTVTENLSMSTSYDTLRPIDVIE